MPKKPELRLRPNTHPVYPFVLPIPKIYRATVGGGKRYFKTERAGKDYIRHVQTALNACGVRARMLTHEQRIDAARAMEIMEPFSTSLTELAEDYRAVHIENVVSSQALPGGG